MRLPALLLALTASACAQTTPSVPARPAPASPAALTCATTPTTARTFPPQPSWAALASATIAADAAAPFKWWQNITPGGHTWNGDYLNSRVGKGFGGPNVQWDDGVPLVKYGDAFYKNPITIAQYALKMHSTYLYTKADTDRAAFLHAVDVLLGMQDERGAFLHPFTFREARNLVPYAPGWPSALAQGQALSTLARAFDVTQDSRYLDAGHRAYAYLTTPLSAGGVLSDLGDIDPILGRFAFFEEYPPIAPASQSHVLNGFMFTLLGLYDWARTPGAVDAPEAAGYFECGVATLQTALPLYDLGQGVKSYDLGHLQPVKTTGYPGQPLLGSAYQGVHIYLLQTLDTIVPGAPFRAAAAALADATGHPLP